MIHRILSLMMLGGACVCAATESVEVLPGVSLRSELVPEMRAWQCFAPFIDVTRLGFLADCELDDTVVFDIEQGEGQPSLLCRLCHRGRQCHFGGGIQDNRNGKIKRR